MESNLEFSQLKSQEKKPMEFAQTRVVLCFLVSGATVALVVFAWEMMMLTQPRHAKLALSAGRVHVVVKTPRLGNIF